MITPLVRPYEGLMLGLSRDSPPPPHSPPYPEASMTQRNQMTKPIELIASRDHWTCLNQKLRNLLVVSIEATMFGGNSRREMARKPGENSPTKSYDFFGFRQKPRLIALAHKTCLPPRVSLPFAFLRSQSPQPFAGLMNETHTLGPHWVVNRKPQRQTTILGGVPHVFFSSSPKKHPMCRGISSWTFWNGFRIRSFTAHFLSGWPNKK